MLRPPPSSPPRSAARNINRCTKNASSIYCVCGTSCFVSNRRERIQPNFWAHNIYIILNRPFMCVSVMKLFSIYIIMKIAYTRCNSIVRSSLCAFHFLSSVECRLIRLFHARSRSPLWLHFFLFDARIVLPSTPIFWFKVTTSSAFT